MSLGPRDGGREWKLEQGWGERWRGGRDGLADVHTDLSCQLWIRVVRERKWRVKHIEWFRIHLKPGGLESAFMQRNGLSVSAAIQGEQWRTSLEAEAICFVCFVFLCKSNGMSRSKVTQKGNFMMTSFEDRWQGEVRYWNRKLRVLMVDKKSLRVCVWGGCFYHHRLQISKQNVLLLQLLSKSVRCWRKLGYSTSVASHSWTK